jgi:hypothetical protein
VRLLPKLVCSELRSDMVSIEKDAGSEATHFPLEECSSFDLALLLQAINNILVAPSNLMGQSLHTSMGSVTRGFILDVEGFTFTVQYFLPGLSLRTRNASGTTILFLRS